MALSVTIGEDAKDLGPPSIDNLAAHIQKWSAMCGQFLVWERQHMILAEPSEKEKVDHRQVLKWLLRLTRMMHSLIADPEFPDRSLVSELEGRVWQLERSWRMIYEAMEGPEAEKLLKETFTSTADQALLKKLFP